ncbi:hypothetical protein CL689_02100 [Candidatus Saccharibacteria bacterium]|nr:hypothetical protein [Candidatus Saccharibacteria bacterium]|tara:strand:- start:1020 stop:1241 length:222 start_codon:yes stop_codon:yes gene_type:complete
MMPSVWKAAIDILSSPAFLMMSLVIGAAILTTILMTTHEHKSNPLKRRIIKLGASLLSAVALWLAANVASLFI